MSDGLELEVRTGKPLDVLALKGTSLDELRDYSSRLAATAARLYGPGSPSRTIAECPCCERPSADAPEALRVFDVPYVTCLGCAHAFVRVQPELAVLERLFADEETHSAEYVDPQAVELRLEQVVRPKLDWAYEVAARHVGERPARAIDVGAGGGHVVAELLRNGLAAEGFELSAASRAFASEQFGLELRADDFLAAEPEAVELVTMFGLLEYTPGPRRFLEAARSWLEPGKGLLVVEVPRFDCLGTAVQRQWPQTVARHLDPTSHVNCFSDASLATALRACRFRPVAAWYFGMDAYELLVQTALALDDPAVLEGLAETAALLQAALDEARRCDDLIVAAVPV